MMKKRRKQNDSESSNKREDNEQEEKGLLAAMEMMIWKKENCPATKVKELDTRKSLIKVQETNKIEVKRGSEEEVSHKYLSIARINHFCNKLIALDNKSSNNSK